MRCVRLVIVALLVLVASASIVEAQQCFFGQIRFFAGNFVPVTHLPAHGQLLENPPPNTPPHLLTPEQQIASALFPLLETRFGGSAPVFALPDLRGRAPIGVGQSAGTSNRTVGETGGAETVTLDVGDMASHSHTALGTNDAATDPDPEGNVWAGKARTRLYGPPTALGAMNANALEPVGAAQALANMTPFIVLTPLICTGGGETVFPERP